MLKQCNEGQAVVDPADYAAHRARAGTSHGAFLADLDHGVACEFIRRHNQVLRRWALADPPRGIVDRAMARTKPATVLTAVVSGLLTERDATEIGADADDHQPVRLLHSRRIRMRIAARRDVDILRGFNLLWRAVVDEDGLSTPGNRQTLPCLHRREVDLGGGQSQGVACRVQTCDEWPN